MHLPRVWADIDLGQLALNLGQCRWFVPPSCSVLGVVKADAYGHGAVQVAAELERNGIGMLGVGDSNEAIRLREAGITTPILVLGAVVDGEIPELIHHRIIPMIHSPERIDIFQRIAQKLGVRMPVQLLIDTGMGRLGVTPARALEHLRAILDAPNLRLEGAGTHLASPIEDSDFTREQLAVFARCIAEARAEGIEIPILHAAGSGALLRYPDSHYDMVRVGGFLYGIAAEALPAGIRPVLSLYTQIVYLRDHPVDVPIGYGGTWRTPAPARLATLPIGYHDGFLHQLSNHAELLVRGQRAPVVGRVTMDYVTIDVTHIQGASVGDRVTVLGQDGEERITALDLAERAGSISYAIPCHLGNRVRRFYRSADAPAAREVRRRVPEPCLAPELQL